MDTHKEAKTTYQVYDKDGRTALILAIITPLMIRVHQKRMFLKIMRIFSLFFFVISVPLQFLHFLNTFQNLHLKLNWWVLIINSLLL